MEVGWLKKKSKQEFFYIIQFAFKAFQAISEFIRENIEPLKIWSNYASWHL